jgi:tRNA-2-methylthio-N6-dimethylallyladenosine synthase
VGRTGWPIEEVGSPFTLRFDRIPGMKYFIQTFGCAANVADSERVAAMLEARGMTKAASIATADQIVINTCMVRQSAEDRVYGLVRKLAKLKIKNRQLKIVITGCLAGAAAREKTGKYLAGLRERLPEVDEFLPIEEVGFDFAPLRSGKTHAWVPISNGCNNFCTFCIVPFTRGREVSRPFDEIVTECRHLSERGYTAITLVGQNVNSYGADILVGDSNIQTLRDLDKKYFKENVKKTVYKDTSGRVVKPTYIKHLGKFRLPTLFPRLLSEVAATPGVTMVDFISSNPWDFSNQLIEVIANNKNISRLIHLPVQSGSNSVLARMNRWYTRDEYVALTINLKSKIKDLQLSTDIIVGFPEETEQDFADTVDLVGQVNFFKAYLAMYSPRPYTTAFRAFPDDIPHKEKRRRWLILEQLINTPSRVLKTY